MNTDNIDFMLLYFQINGEKHKKNIRNAYKSILRQSNDEKKRNGVDNIYQNALNNYLQLFREEEYERKKEAEQLRLLKQYIHDVSLDDEDRTKEHLAYCAIEQDNISNELASVNNDINEIAALIAKHGN